MILGRTGQVAKEDFSVLDLAGNLKSGITLTEFSEALYEPDGSLSSIAVTFSELGGGHYRASFTPDSAGFWYLIVTHTTYFPWGKSGTILVFDEDFDTIAVDVEFIKQVESGRWKIDETTNQMIFYKDDNVTEIMRFNLLDSAEAPSVTDVFERTRVTTGTTTTTTTV